MATPIRSLICIASLLIAIQSKCSYTQPEGGGVPIVYDGDSFPINYTMQACKDFIGGEVCCNQVNARLTADNFKQIDGAFSTLSGGCDICAINLKRLWCQYACSPRQAEFLNVSKEIYVYPDPMKPGHTITAQEANLTIEATTACAIYNSCKRTPFVSSVSALSSTAGFLNFQGHSAIDNARQYISVYFTYDPAKGLYFNNATGKEKTADITQCDFKGTQLHQFPILGNCSCNTCEESCDTSQGYHYTEPALLEGFNYGLVLGIWGGAIAIGGGLTLYRFQRDKKKRQ